MKLHLTKSEWEQLPILNQLFLALWKKQKGYSQTKELSFGELVELSFALTHDLHYDSPSERTTFNNSLDYDEIRIAWDGVEPIDTLNYELQQKLKRRITQVIALHSK